MTYKKRQQEAENSGISWMPLILVGICAFLFFSNLQYQGTPRPDDEKSIVDDEKTVPSRVPKGVVILIHERQPMSAGDIAIAAGLEDLRDANPGFDFRSVDILDKSPKVKERIDWAASKGVKPPLALWQNESNEPVRAIPMPKDLEGLKKVWK